MKRIALVGCGKTKRPGTHPAADLYTGRLFTQSLAFARANFEQVFILSGLHGLLDLTQPVEAYEHSLRACEPWERADWGCVVMAVQLARRFDVTKPLELHVFAGRTYVEPLRWQLCDYPQWAIEEPMRGLQLGQRLSWLSLQMRRAA